MTALDRVHGPAPTRPQERPDPEMTPDPDPTEVLYLAGPPANNRRAADQWPAHRAKARRQKAQRRALGREPKNRRGTR